jgi:hypothetical protein
MRIESQENLNNMIADRPEAVSREERLRFDHAAVASQAIKMINSIRMDDFVRRVMTLRIMGPMITGHERTHLSIALELGATEDDVIQAEQYGMKVVEDLLQKVNSQEFVNKFNAEEKLKRTIESEIKRGNSARSA